MAVLCYQLLSGRLPFTGHSVEELIESHLKQKPLRLRDVGRRVHPELEALLQKALAKDPQLTAFTTGARDRPRRCARSRRSPISPPTIIRRR